MSYLKRYVDGKLPFYNPRPPPYDRHQCDRNIEAVGRDVGAIQPGRRVVVSTHLLGGRLSTDPPQILIGLTASPDAAPMLADWPDGTLADYALAPVEAVTPLDGLERLEAAHLVGSLATSSSIWRAPSRAPRGGRDVIVNGDFRWGLWDAAVLLGVAMGPHA